MADPCASDLRNAVAVQRPSFTDDGAGGRVVSWIDYAEVWSAVRLKSGSEPLYRGRKETRADALFTLRYRDDLRTVDRLIHRGLVYAITAVEDVRREHKWTVVEARLDAASTCYLLDDAGEAILTNTGGFIFVNNGGRCDPAYAPTITPESGSFGVSVTVTMTSATPGASIRYTLDGSAPTESVGTLYAGPFSLTESATVRAVAYADGISRSSISSVVYVIVAAAPVATPGGGVYESSALVTLTAGGASIRYTLDGTDPSPSVGTVYAAPFSITASSELRAIAYASGVDPSSILSEDYEITVADPVADPAGDDYAGAEFVTLTTSTPGASIRYTLDGTDPSPSVGTVYAAPVLIDTAVELRAIAYKTGATTSGIISETYDVPGAVAWNIDDPAALLTYTTARTVEPFTVT